MSSTFTIASDEKIGLENRVKGVGKRSLLQRLGVPHHEYWSWWLLVMPVWPLWLWYCLRLNNATWFTSVNPAIEDGGFMGESKMKIMDLIPSDLKPKTLFIARGSSVPNKSKLNEFYGGVIFPIIAKPDIGGRGRKIKILENENDLTNYHTTVGEDYMLQEMIVAPLELGVFYSRLPNQANGKIISLASKGFLKVIGDGKSSIKELMQKCKRASLQINRLAKELDVSIVPKENEEILLEPIGNHCKGTMFLNEEERVSEKLNLVFDEIAKRIGGIYYGRFDIRVPNWQDLENGKNISILELNGLTSDATHIYDPNYSLGDAFRTQFKHVRISAAIARQNLSQGVKTTPVLELIKKSWEALKMM